MVMCLPALCQGAGLHLAQLMPLPDTLAQVNQIGFAFLVLPLCC